MLARDLPRRSILIFACMFFGSEDSILTVFMPTTLILHVHGHFPITFQKAIGYSSSSKLKRLRLSYVLKDYLEFRVSSLLTLDKYLQQQQAPPYIHAQ